MYIEYEPDQKVVGSTDFVVMDVVPIIDDNANIMDDNVPAQLKWNPQMSEMVPGGPNLVRNRHMNRI